MLDSNPNDAVVSVPNKQPQDVLIAVLNSLEGLTQDEIGRVLRSAATFYDVTEDLLA